MNIYTTSEARAKLFKIVETTRITHEPIYVKSKKGDAVILSREDYEAMQETLYLHSIPNLVCSILEAEQEPLEECIEWKDDL